MQPGPVSFWRQLTGNDQFRWLFVGNTTLFFGFFATILLRSLLVWELTGDEMALAYINLVAAICMFTTSLFSGVIIDRRERRQLIFWAQLVVFLAESVILALLITDRLSFPFLLMSAIAASVAFPFIMPARTAILVDAVGKPPLGKATAMLTGGVNIARMVSPALIGFLVDATSFVYGYAFLLTIHFISLSSTYRLRRYPADEGGRDGFLREVVRGFSYIAENRSMAMAILFGALPLLIVVPLQNLMVVFVDELWDAGGSGLGIMMGTMGIGGLLGSLVMALLREDSLVRPMVLGTLCMGAFLVLFSHSSNFWVAVVMVMGIYSCSVFSQTLVQTAVQLMAEDFIRGRITTVTMMSFSLAPMGTIPLAWATKEFGADWAMTIAAGLLVAAVLLMWALSSAFRGIDEAARI
jgi:MFS family permease